MNWMAESTYDFLNLLNKNYRHEYGIAPHTNINNKIIKFLNEKYAPMFILVNVRPKFQRMKKEYKLYIELLNNTKQGTFAL